MTRAGTAAALGWPTRRRFAATLECLIALGLAACGSDKAPQPTSERPRGRLQAPPESQPAPAAPAQPGNAPAPAAEEAPVAAPEPAAAAEAEAKEEKKQRDYAAELLAALGTPADCLHERSGEAAPSELKIDIQAYLLDSGFVSRAYARSPLLDEGELQCLSKRAGALRLTAPIEDAPRAVSATLTLQLKAADKPAVADKPGTGTEKAVPAENPAGAEP
jgi:hypothetical protein